LLAGRDLAGVGLMRPVNGFHPLKYADECKDYPRGSLQNPLAHYVRAGRPEGSWTHEVIRPSKRRRDVPPLRVALQAHYHYPELLPNLVARLNANRTRCDLYISTTTDAATNRAEMATAGFAGGTVEIRKFPNRGRDIGAFLTGFAKELHRGYDVIGHVHGKRSLNAFNASSGGEPWREFLWQNLVGPKHAMADTIIHRFAEDPKLGLVFPEDPHLIGWDANLAIAAGLAARLGLSKPLPTHLDFPVGTMFWARPEALASLFELQLSWDDYPDEPLPADGTLLHALERLLPVVATEAGYRYATTEVPGVHR
jgi:lipopolysaccharide biosynthesis protein